MDVTIRHENRNSEDINRYSNDIKIVIIMTQKQKQQSMTSRPVVCENERGSKHTHKLCGPGSYSSNIFTRSRCLFSYYTFKCASIRALLSDTLSLYFYFYCNERLSLNYLFILFVKLITVIYQKLTVQHKAENNTNITTKYIVDQKRSSNEFYLNLF